MYLPIVKHIILIHLKKNLTCESRETRRTYFNKKKNECVKIIFYTFKNNQHQILERHIFHLFFFSS